jgi:hypothetical protein
MTLFSRSGVNVAVAIVVALHVSVLWVIWATVVGSLAGFGALGWLLARRISAAYRVVSATMSLTRSRASLGGRPKSDRNVFAQRNLTDS